MKKPNNVLATAVLLGGLAAAPAHADNIQVAPDGTILSTPVATTQKTVATTQKATAKTATILDTTIQSGANITLGAEHSELYGTGVKGRLIKTGDTCGMVIDGKVSKKDIDTLLAFGCSVIEKPGASTILFAGGAYRGTDASVLEDTNHRGLTGTLTSAQGFAGVRTAAERYALEGTLRAGSARSTLVGRSSSQSVTERVEVGADETRTIQTTTLTERLTEAVGKNWANGEVKATLSVSDRGELFLSGSIGKIGDDRFHEESLGYAVNIGKWSLSTDIRQTGYNWHHAVTGGLAWAAPVSAGSSLGYTIGARTDGHKGGTTVYVGLEAKFGGGAYRAPIHGGNQSQKSLEQQLREISENRLNHAPEARSVYSLQDYYKTTISEKTTKIEKNNTPVSLSAITGPASLTAGTVGEYIFTATDKDGMPSVMIRVNGQVVVPTSVSAAGIYTFQMKAGDTAEVVATGKMPDGYLGAPDVKRTTLTVNTAPSPIDHIATVTLPILSLTPTSVTFSGAVIADADNLPGFDSKISYVVQDMSGHTVDPMALTPGTSYRYKIVYVTVNGATAQVDAKETAFQPFTTPEAPVVPPTVPTNIPSSFSVNSDIGSIDLSAYMQAGWTIEVVSVADPGVANEVGSPNVTVNGSTVNITVPLGYGTYNIPMTLYFKNSAGSSSNFTITALNIGA